MQAYQPFPIILKVANKRKISIYGNDWPTKDGTCIRDYIHVMDLADAHLAALEYLRNNQPQIISLNIGTGKGTSVLEIINKFVEINKSKFHILIKKKKWRCRTSRC